MEPLIPNQSITTKVQFRDSGKTPAISDGGAMVFEVIRKVGDLKFEYTSERASKRVYRLTHNTLFPYQNFADEPFRQVIIATGSTDPPEFLSANEQIISDVRNGDATVVLHGTMKYHDTFK